MSKRVVVASGYFNPLHYGHVSYLQKARDAGTSLIVIVNNDKQAAQRLHSEPGFRSHGMPARDRVKLIRSLACVDCAMEAMDQDDSVAETLRLLHPDVFANGGKTTANAKEVEVCKELGIEILDGLGIEFLLLKPYTQHYDWGKPRRQSKVAALAGEANVVSPRPVGAGGASSSNKPFAELWMGDHPSGPSSVKTPGGAVVGCLRQTLGSASSLLGPKLQEQAQLPFLLKVLSIHKALSIQAHPDRALAKRLHEERPDVYKDANHKPEIAIALTDFEALCGFRPLGEFVDLVSAVPELRSLIGGDDVVSVLRKAASSSIGTAEAESAAAMKAAYSRMMNSGAETVKDHVRKLVARARAVSSAAASAESASPPSSSLQFVPPARSTIAPGEEPELVEEADTTPSMPRELALLVLRLHEQFGEDIGIFSIFFLNYVNMTVGDCLYMAQNVPHAYLSGDIVECMACSDNVVRGGLTSKFKDVEVLCEMLDYRGGPPRCIKAQELEPGFLLYADPELEEFQVTHLTFTAGRKLRKCFSSFGPALAFAYRGEGTVKISGETLALSSGVVFLLAAGVDADIEADTDLDIFVACCPDRYFNPYL